MGDRIPSQDPAASVVRTMLNVCCHQSPRLNNMVELVGLLEKLAMEGETSTMVLEKGLLLGPRDTGLKMFRRSLASLTYL
ncbi:hypothetical protein QQP08_025644 [Theobroma cacao]|nr:hypothetical protein QQP08_025644 [Theobroma cacao]